MTKRMKWGIGGIVLVGIAAYVAVTAARQSGRGTEVRIEAVESRDLVASVTASGQVQPRTKVDVAADISGRIVRLAVKEGEMVKKGQFLLEIDPAQYQAAVQRSEAALAAARAQAAQSNANLLQARRNFERSAEIKKSNPTLISDEQIEQLRTQADVDEALHEAARHQVDQASASLKDARSNLARTTILAPMDGQITRLVVEQGETAVPGTFNKDAATLLTISDMTVLETKVKVDETDVARVSVGDSAIIQIDAFPDTTFVGRVTDISNSSVTAGVAGQSTDQAVDYEVTIQLLNHPADTRPDFSATAKVVTDVRSKVLSIPIIALTVRENEPLGDADTATIPGRRAPVKQIGRTDVEGVFVVGADNKVTFRPVKVGIAGERYFEVLSGLKAGERIVGGTYQAIRELTDGALVREAEVPPTSTAQATKS
ncbi:MAG TPA: efflux RND transporter periplasmic adaptor subunit [Gemmatimonadaceae bacterium]|nr:efflux RND transporter periplasmic adaptor subunit [Gemmatimonadaceae bacterium]